MRQEHHCVAMFSLRDILPRTAEEHNRDMNGGRGLRAEVVFIHLLAATGGEPVGRVT